MLACGRAGMSEAGAITFGCSNFALAFVYQNITIDLRMVNRDMSYISHPTLPTD